MEFLSNIYLFVNNLLKKFEENIDDDLWYLVQGDKWETLMDDYKKYYITIKDSILEVKYFFIRIIMFIARKKKQNL